MRRKYKWIAQSAAKRIVISALAISGIGCVAVQELTLEAPPNSGSHLLAGQRFLVVGPTKVRRSELGGGFVHSLLFGQECLIVVPLPSDPVHKWNPAPICATKRPGSTNEYDLKTTVTSGDAGHTDLDHDFVLTVKSNRPLEIEITSATTHGAGGGAHGGSMLMR